MKSFVISTTDERIEFLKKKDKRLGKVINAIGPIECKQIGLSNSKCEYIKGFSMAVKEKTICLEELYKKDDEEVIKELTSIRGIGKWTAKMYFYTLIFIRHFL